MNAPGDALYSFNGYSFDTAATVSLDYPREVRSVIVPMAGVDFGVDLYGTSAAPIKATDLTVEYLIQKSTNDLLKSEIMTLREALQNSAVGALFTIERDGSTLQGAMARFKSMDVPIDADIYTDCIVTLIWTPLSSFGSTIYSLGTYGTSPYL